MSQLQELQILSREKIQNEELESLVEVPQLKKLRILGCGLSDASLTHLTDLKNLQVLEIYTTGVTEAGINELKKSLPNLTIDEEGGMRIRGGTGLF
jgi:hypothetical protein